MVIPVNDADSTQRRQQMKRLMTLGTPIAAALTIAACGGTGSSGSASTAAGSTPASGGSTTVSVRQLPAVGSVLVDNTGKALYANNLETAGKILCNDPGCNAFWTPLTLRAGMPTAPANVGKLGVTKRPDGTAQVTANGRPLYTFSEDSSGKATGNGFQDQFAGHNFTWNVVLSNGTLAGTTGSGSGAATPNSTSATSGNYGQ
jgi:predicted lipoprotein with Yx(FWY)xxD motif